VGYNLVDSSGRGIEIDVLDVPRPLHNPACQAMNMLKGNKVYCTSVAWFWDYLHITEV